MTKRNSKKTIQRNRNNRDLRAESLKASIAERAYHYSDESRPNWTGEAYVKFFDDAFSSYLETDSEIRNEMEALIDDIMGIQKVEPNREAYMKNVIERFVHYLQTEMEIEWLTSDGYAHYKNNYW